MIYRLWEDSPANCGVISTPLDVIKIPGHPIYCCAMPNTSSSQMDYLSDPTNSDSRTSSGGGINGATHGRNWNGESLDVGEGNNNNMKASGEKDEGGEEIVEQDKKRLKTSTLTTLSSSLSSSSNSSGSCRGLPPGSDETVPGAGIDSTDRNRDSSSIGREIGRDNNEEENSKARSDAETNEMPVSVWMNTVELVCGGGSGDPGFIGTPVYLFSRPL